ncbi:oligosaccharide flippase family protein [Pseudoxanthomonas putridarboris]|uniref:Oligosaccharide flippase family protein n=1 Tax=Pseudoxanthomonas putridarboris TaxID=752605 RepID=A0ABU9IYH5_9GAMM
MTVSSSMLSRTMFSTIAIYTEFVIGMLVSILIARHLQPAGFGTYSVAVWMVALGVVLANSGTGTAAIKFVAELRGSGDTALIAPTLAYIRRAQHVFLAVVLAIGGAAMLLAGDHVVPELHHGLLTAFLAVSVVVRSQYMLNIGAAKGFENFRVLAVVAGVSAPLTLLMVAVAAWLDAPIEAFLGIFVLSGVVLYLMSRRHVARLIPPSPEGIVLPPELLARVRRHMRLTAVTVSLGFLIGSEIEVLFLKMYASESMAGQFKVAYQLASGATQLVPGVFGAILLPMMANALKQSTEVAAQRFVTSTRYLALLAAPLIAFGMLFSGAIVTVLYGKAYAPAGPVFAACLMGLAITTATQGGSSLLVSADRQTSILKLQIVLVILKLALGIALIKLYGLAGAVYAFWVVSLVYVMVVIRLAIHTCGTSPQWGKLFRIALAAVIAAAVAYPVLHHLPAVAAILTGGLVVSLVYVLLTFAFNCWSQTDIEQMQALHGRLGRRRIPAVDFLLDRARQRA